jgi:hypothetical protein
MTGKRMTILARIPVIVTILICITVTLQAAGPAFVAGSGYNPGVEGQALIWANAEVQYFTDQGSLSPILTNAQANALVAAAFNTWTTLPGIALTATPAGQLAEDVNGGNIETNGDGVVTAPADVTSSATATPVGIVYDYDGTVTDALLGVGAGNLSDCFTNAVYGVPDNFSTAGNIVHSLVVINGICAATSTQLPDVQYRLIRVLGRTLGMGWSQANLNVLTRNPPPTAADFAGFPVMHFIDPINCVPISACYPNPGVPNMDDTNSLAQLYPLANNPQLAGGIYGSVYFTDASGNALQPMQGVNVIARLMVAGQPSRQYAVSSVSGFSFCGNAGNIIDGYLDGTGLRYDRWGSNDQSLEGYFNFPQLTIPTPQTIAEYQLTVEALDPAWSLGVVPYAPNQVTPSGSFPPVVVTITNAANVERDILMLQDEIAETHPGSGSTYAVPAALPQGGTWGSWISGYGSTDWFEFTAQANRTASVSVIALNEAGQPTETKLLPVIGIWELSDESRDPAPASTPSAFNTVTFGLSRLDAQFSVSEAYRVGVTDFRGDGRPDYFYQASLLYSDTVTPARLSIAGGVTTLNGIGFSQGLQVTIAGSNSTQLSASASQIQLAAPAASLDGTATIQVTDPLTGSFSQMLGALTYGAASTDLLLLLQGSETATPVGAPAPSPIRVRAVAADGVTPVSGATIAWSANNGTQFSACSGTSSCSVLSDEAGESSTSVTPTTTGPSTITIALAPASYSPPQTQQSTLVATSTTLDLAALTPTRWIAQGATLAIPLTVEALDLGVPMANVKVNFAVTQGAATLSASSSTTNSSGFATVTAQLTNQNAAVQVSACVAPNNAPCQIFTMFSTPSSLWNLETVSGSSQFVLTNQTFQPLVMRVTDSSPAANPVMGVSVSFQTTLARVSPDANAAANDGMPIILGSSQSQVATTQNGLATIMPSAENVGPCDVFIIVNAGASTDQFQLENLAAIVLSQPPKSVGIGVKAPSPTREPRFSSQIAAPQSTPMLSAMPQGIPNNDPPADAQAAACPESSTPESSADLPPTPVASTVSVLCGSKPAKVEAPTKEAQAQDEVVHLAPSSPAKPQPNPASAVGLPTGFPTGVPKTNEAARFWPAMARSSNEFFEAGCPIHRVLCDEWDSTAASFEVHVSCHKYAHAIPSKTKDGPTLYVCHLSEQRIHHK